jgi:hypothetical protein
MDGSFLRDLGTRIGAAQVPTATTTSVLTPTTVPATTPVTDTTISALTPTVPATTPVIVPTVPPVAPPPAANPLSPDYLTAAASPPLGPFGLAFLVLGLVILGAGLYYYFVVKNRWKRSNALKYRTTNFWSLSAIILGVASLLFVLFRVLNVGGLNIHLWLYLLTLVILGFGLYGAYFFTQVYPKQLAAQSKRVGAKGGKPAPRTSRPVATPRGSGRGAPPAEAAPADKGPSGNPRGTSPRGERRREKR